MIIVTRRNGTTFALNPDLVERAEATPDTVLTLVDGSRFVVNEAVAEVVDLVRDFRASVVARARALDADPAPTPARALHAVPHPAPEA